MKKVLITLIAISFISGVFAQDSTTSMNKMAPKQNRQNHEGVIMKGGKLFMVKDDQTTQLTSDLTLDNGTIVMANGSIKTKEGTISTLKEGDYVGMDGSMSTQWPQNNKKDSTMLNKMRPDSGK